MILPLRRRHRIIVSVLAVILPIAFASGIAARKTIPAPASRPTGLVSESTRFKRVIWEEKEWWTSQGIRTLLLSDTDGKLAVQLRADTTFTHPDLLVYWVSGPTTIGDKLPTQANLVGTFASELVLPLPTEAGKQNGHLLLYSLANAEIVTASKPFVVGADAKEH